MDQQGLSIAVPALGDAEKPCLTLCAVLTQYEEDQASMPTTHSGKLAKRRTTPERISVR